MTRVRAPAVAGSFYPEEPELLRSAVHRYLRSASASSADPPKALIAPHAGFVYSGRVAARGFRLLSPTGIDRVILIGPSHYAALDGAFVPESTTYRTPLGEVAIDYDLAPPDGFDEARDEIDLSG